VHFLCLEPRETNKNVLNFSKNWVLKFHFLLLGALQYTTGNRAASWLRPALFEHGGITFLMFV